MANPGGSRLWHLKYRIIGKEFRLSLGAYPDVSLTDARQAIDILRQIQTISGLFPGDHSPYKPMCENTVNKALRLMEYDTETDSAATDSGRWTVAL